MLGTLVCSTVSCNKVLFETAEELGRSSRLVLLIAKLSGLFSLFLSFYPVDSYLTKISFRNCE